MNIEQQAQALLSSELELQSKEGIPFIELLADKIAYLLDHNPDLLFSYFYRLDIDEHKIERIILQQGPVPINLQLAQLVLDRQIQRARTKANYRTGEDIDWMDFPE